MAASRRSPKRKILQPLKASRRTNAINLGITSARRSAISTGSATMTQSPPAETRRCSLRNAGPTIPSPGANRVRFVGEGSARPEGGCRYPPTPRAVAESQTSTMPEAPRSPTTRASPALQLSPRTTQKAREAAKVIREQTAFLDEKLDSPPPISSKKNNFQGRGNRVSTGQPPTPEQHSHTRYDGKTPDRPGRGALPTPPTTLRPNKTRPRTPPNKAGTTTPAASPPIRKITITETNEQRQIYIDGVSDWLSFPSPPTQRFSASSPPIEIPTSALLHHMATLKTTPRPLALEELHINFYLLQKMLRQFTKRHFRSTWSESRQESFASNFADLATTSAPFYRIAAYLADGATFRDGWTSFLSSEHTRPHLAYAILSEWLKHNVFGHSCFGLSAAEDDLMTAIDIRYLHYDGFVRTKERAKLLRRILAEKAAWEVDMDMGCAVETVVEDLLVVLAPILPSRDADDGRMVELRAQLASLVDVAANLHQCIRLTGMDGTILRFQSSGKGDQFAYTARQNCVNKSTVSETVDEMIDERNRTSQSAAAKTAGAEAVNAGAGELTARVRDKLVIKMPCFPHVLAVVPFGPTLRDFAVEQDVYSQTIRSEDLPSLASDGAGPMYIEDIPAEIVRAACLEAMPESCHRDYGRRTDDGETRTQAYGSYVKQYVLNESDVYCEWEFEGEVNTGKGMTLRDAVEQAQREKYGCVPAERRATWARRKEVGTNLVKGVATVGVVAAVGYGIARHTAMGMAAVSAIKELKLPGSFSIEEIKGAVKSAMEAADARTNTFQKASRLPYKITKEYTKKWAHAPLAAAKSQFASAQLRAQRFVCDTGGVSDLASSALAKASNVTEAAASVVKDTVLGEETPEATPTSGLLSDILEPIDIGEHETTAKLGIELGRVADPTSRVSKTTEAAARKTATAVAAVARWYEQMVRGAGNRG